MSKRTQWIIGSGLAVVALAAGFVAWRVFGGQTPAEAALTSLAPAASGSATGGSSDGFAGTWTSETTSGSIEDGSATFAGYRIEEELGGVGANTAVGRTRGVDVT